MGLGGPPGPTLFATTSIQIFRSIHRIFVIEEYVEQKKADVEVGWQVGQQVREKSKVSVPSGEGGK